MSFSPQIASTGAVICPRQSLYSLITTGATGDEPGDLLGNLGQKRQRVRPLIDGETTTGRSILSSLSRT